MTGRLRGKNAVIIGGSRGIGAAIAELFVREGAAVCLISRSERDLQETVRKINSMAVGGSMKAGAGNSENPAAEYIVGDISSAESMRQAFLKYAEKNRGRDDGVGSGREGKNSVSRRIDILVANSGIYRENSETHKWQRSGSSEAHGISEVYGDGAGLEIRHAVVQEIINTNMLGYWWSTLLAEPLLSDGGSVIYISSVNGIRGKGISDIYDMSKAAVNVHALNAARQLAPRRIRVNAVCPSSTITPMRDDAMRRYPPSTTRKEFDLFEAGTLPFGRLATAEDIAAAALHFASDESRYTTGTILQVDGGFMLLGGHTLLQRK